MQRILAQSGKEWKQFRRDPLSMWLAVLMPVVMVLLFGYTLSLDPDGLRLVIRDLDNSALSRRYVETYIGAADFQLIAWDSELAVEQALETGAAEMVLLIPPHFGRDLLAGRPAQAQALIDGADANTALILRQTASALNASFLARENPALAPPVRARIRYWYNPGLSDRRFFGTGALGMVLIFFPALLGAIAASREHELGTVIQAYASTLTPAEWVIGTALPYVAVGCVELVCGYLSGAVAFGYDLPPDPTAFLAASVGYIAIGVLFGMWVGHATRSQSISIQAVQLGVFLLSLLLSGFLAPLENIPKAIRWLSYFIPARYYVEVVRDALLRQGGWRTNGLDVVILLGLAMLGFWGVWSQVRRMRFPD
ncbi:MAG: ABC transporter permease subunit [Acidobacteria bacterium]|nr:ABC transporter permease subunit [Acidobacteriota bacterium]